ncbi:hypothetical protein BSKO_02474 [Bryopsis sp. KO-2023]|nr:hypothetical protein BSKO_02474 [Bryopsis sp. KO-2023]
MKKQGVAMRKVPAVEWDLPLTIIKGILEKTSKRDLAKSRSVASTWWQASKDPRLSEILRGERLWRSKEIVPILTPILGGDRTRCAAKKDDLIVLGGYSSLVYYNTKVGPESCVSLDVGNNVVFVVQFIDKMLLSGDFDGTLCAWDVDSANSLFNIDAHWDALCAIEELREEVATAGADCLIILWGKEDWKEKNVLRGHKKSVSTLSSTDDKKRLISGSYDKTIRIWDVAERICLGELVGHDDVLEQVLVWGSMIASCCDQDARLWNLNDGSELRAIRGHSNFIPCIAFACDRLILGSSDGVVSVWDIEHGDCIRKLKVPNPSPLAFLWCDERRLIGVTCNGDHVMWDFV